jgi:hypothetical protein
VRLIKYHTMETYEGMEVKVAAHMLNLGTNGDEWSASRPGRFASLDAMKSRKVSCLCRESNPNSSVVQPAA